MCEMTGKLIEKLDEGMGGMKGAMDQLLAKDIIESVQDTFNRPVLAVKEMMDKPGGLMKGL